MPGRHRAPTAARRTLRATREAVTARLDGAGAVAAHALEILLPRTPGALARSVAGGFLPGAIHPEARR
ncbi:hypothetical protein [Amycolatopsis sp. VC5-11]|uniref:hypothetical protein n=1 Tax=Amycolatopsis sp. VC5-11 TaxID=3120156 RepID=UPI00300A7A93